MATTVQRDQTDGGTREGAGPDPAAIMRELAAYEAASATFNGWVQGAQALALLKGALDAGIFDAARAPRTPAEIAELTGFEEEQVADICATLDAHGIFAREDDRYNLAPDFARLTGAGAIMGLPQLVDIRLVEARTLEAIGAPGRPYTALSTGDLLAVAAGVTYADPASPAVQMLMPAWVSEQLPELHARLTAGSRHAEFGCGIGGALLALPLMYPRITAVGFEINAQVIAETRRRAMALGLTDRVELRHADVRDIGDEAAFDTVQWSQGFFPAETRAAALAAARRALKPGGYLFVPGFEGGEPPATTEGLREPQGQAYLRSRLVYRRWGIPTPTADELRAELEGAGFEFVRAAPFGLWQFLLARRPLDA